ncbi:MAG: DUF971 domain-containing protein [Acetobacteraceae bacterium]|nr:DUF971 domain-containing protein [Acetobacteraceae bacterium]
MPVTATNIRVRRATRQLEVTFDDGRTVSLPAEYLRVESPSAEVQGHAPDQKVVVSGKQDVNIVHVEPIGHYAIRIRFSDGHDTGIFTWAYLDRLAAEFDERWAAYLVSLAQRGLKRSA